VLNDHTVFLMALGVLPAMASAMITMMAIAITMIMQIISLSV
jgi:hypothetical protein